MITITYVTFKFNLQLTDQDHVNEHYRNVHGLGGGAAALILFQEIVAKHFNRCVARGQDFRL